MDLENISKYFSQMTKYFKIVNNYKYISIYDKYNEQVFAV